MSKAEEFKSKERIFFENWMCENEYEYDNIPIEELLEAYHKAERKKDFDKLLNK